jgi:hypothetical protein
MLPLATDIGGRLADASWWVVRAGKGEAFVLGDSPVAATLSLGHDDDWRAIFSPESYAVVMPLGPMIALVLAPQRIIPITGIDLDLAGLTRAINRLMWRYADRYVLARDRTQLEAAWPEADEERRRSSVQADGDTERVAMAARRDVTRIVTDLLWRRMSQEWRHWTSCRLEFGWQPWGQRAAPSTCRRSRNPRRGSRRSLARGRRSSPAPFFSKWAARASRYRKGTRDLGLVGCRYCVTHEVSLSHDVRH